jgi:hypothetical protein
MSSPRTASVEPLALIPRSDHGALPGRPGIQLRTADYPEGLSMSFHTANPAGSSHLFPGLIEQTICPLETSIGGGGLYPRCGGSGRSNPTEMAVNFRSRCADESFAPVRVCRCVSRLLLGHRFGAFPAPGGTRSSASPLAPLRGLGSSRNKFENPARERRANFFRAPPRKQTFGTWEPGPLARLRPG